MSSHGGNNAIVTFLVDRINQTTRGIAVDFGKAIQPFMETDTEERPKVLDRHAGTGETSNSLYLMPNLVELDKATFSKLTLPQDLENMLPEVINGDPTATMLFLAEGLKAEGTGKKTSSAEMSAIGVWGERDPKESTAGRGEDNTKRMVDAAVKFIDRWNSLAGPAITN